MDGLGFGQRLFAILLRDLRKPAEIRGFQGGGEASGFKVETESSGLESTSPSFVIPAKAGTQSALRAQTPGPRRGRATRGCPSRSARASRPEATS